MTSSSNVTSDQFRRLSEHFFSLCKEHGHVFVLIDRFNPLPDLLAASIEEAALGTDEQCGLSDPIFGEAQRLAPEVMRLGVEQMPLLDVFANAALLAAQNQEQSDPCVCGFLVAPGLSAKRLASHLSRQFNPLTYDARKIFLRFYDPLVLLQLWRLLGVEQRDKLFGPIDRWDVIARGGELIQLQRENANGKSSHARLMLSEPAIAGTLRIEALNLAIRALRMAGHPIPLHGDAQIDQAITQAQRLGLITNEDLASYAALAWRWPAGHGPMETHAEVAKGIALANRGLPFMDYANERILPIIQANSTP